MTKISKREAAIRYYNNENIYLLPSKARLGSCWISPVCISRDEDSTFEKKVNAYRYYNCTRETGLVVHYYIE